jgi:hypothetical protein
MSTVLFVDTSILCNLLPIPGRDQDRQEVLAEMRMFQEAGHVLILPLTAVVEAGNFIAQVSDGRARRTTATRFSQMLELIIQGRAPWILHQFQWGGEFLRNLVEGADTGLNFIEHAVGALGGGDLCILTEKKIYVERSKIQQVSVWTKDNSLASYTC